jgi:RHS repeat-associated protein
LNFECLHTDHLNTPRTVTRPSDNQLRWRWDPDPFGASAPNQNPQGLGTFVYHLRLPGQYFDTETALHYNYFRNYDPQIGRYVESDPIGLQGGINPYRYAYANPIEYIDPLGLEGVGPWNSPQTLNQWGQNHGQYARGYTGGVKDFWNNYWDMRQAWWKGADKYFHCKANCEAAKRGSGGKSAACTISDTREWWDQNIKKYPASDSIVDQIANRHGRERSAINATASCSEVCAPFRPAGLPKQY